MDNKIIWYDKMLWTNRAENWKQMGQGAASRGNGNFFRPVAPKLGYFSFSWLLPGSRCAFGGKGGPVQSIVWAQNTSKEMGAVCHVYSLKRTRGKWHYKAFLITAGYKSGFSRETELTSVCMCVSFKELAHPGVEVQVQRLSLAEFPLAWGEAKLLAC